MRIIILNVFILLCLAGCGGGPAYHAALAPATPPTQTPAPAPAPAPTPTPTPPPPDPTPPPPPPPPTPAPAPNPLTSLGPGHDAVLRTDSGGRIYAGWIANDGVHVARTVDHGATWTQTAIDTSTPPIFLEMSIRQDDSVNLLFAINDPTTGGQTTSYASSPDGTTFFMKTLQPVQNIQPKMIDSPDAITVAYFTPDLVLLRSTDGGKNFSSTIGWVSQDDAGDLVTIGTHLAWTAGCDILAANLFQGVLTTPVKVNTQEGNCGQEPFISMDLLGTINIVWHDGGKGIWYSRSTDNGTTFTAPVTVTAPGVADLRQAKLTVEDSGIVDVIWAQQFSVMEARSADTFSFNAPAKLSLPIKDGFTGAGDPQIIAACGGQVPIWDDDGAAQQNGIFDIYVSGQNVSNTPDQSEVLPQIISGDAKNFFVAWGTTTSGANPVTENISVLQRNCQ
jgi:hypothetical protein